MAGAIKSILGLGLPDVNKRRDIYQGKRYDIDEILRKEEEEAKKKKESQVAQPPRPNR